MGKLQDKVALVTGSGRGIGREVALKFAREGAKVVVNDIDEAEAEGVVREIQDGGGAAIACVGNVVDADFGERFVGAGIEAFGGLDIFVSNAGYTRDAVIQNMDDQQFQEIMDVHVTAPFRILRAAAEPLRLFAKREAAEGREVIRKVVLISSLAGTGGSAGQINYATAKAGLIGMAKTMSHEWGRYKVCVNCVAFGVIDTRMTRSHDDPDSVVEIGGRKIQLGVPDAARARVTEMIPLRRTGTPQEAAGGVFLLCCPESDYVSGQVLVVSGGL